MPIYTLETAWRVTIGLSLLAPAFWILERFWPGKPGQRRLRKGWRTDAWYLFFTPLITRHVGAWILAGATLPLLYLMGVPLTVDSWLHGWGPLGSLAPLGQAALALVLGDFLGYWTHRWMHGVMWPVHAVHHSSEEVDWMSTLRLHPLNDVLGRLIKGVPFVLLGFSPLVLAALLPLLAAHAFLQHANVHWSFGPLRYVVASPVYHRWHHSAHPESSGKNFAGLFPIWDLLFGTFYLPAAERPRVFGVPSAGVPDAFWRQVLYPLNPTRFAVESRAPGVRRSG